MKTNWLRLPLSFAAVAIFMATAIALHGGDDPWKKKEKARTNLLKARRFAAEYKTDKASDAAREALKDDPTLAEAHVWVGLHRLRESDLKEAEAEFRRALEMDTYQAAAHCYLGYIFYQQKQYDNAQDELTLSAKLDPTSPQTFAALGLVKFKQGMREEGTRAYEKALSYDKRYSDAKFLAGDKGPRWPREMMADVEQLLPLVQKPSF